MSEAKSNTLRRLVRLLGESNRMTEAWRQQRDAILIEVGRVMRNERHGRKVSLRELARRLNVSAQFLSDMERGNRKYTLEWCHKATFALLEPNRARKQ